MKPSPHLALLTLLLGSIYAGYAIIGLLSGKIDVPRSPILPGGGVALPLIILLISSLYLYAVPLLIKGELDGLSCLLAALLLSAIIGTVQILSAGADALDSLITGEPFNPGSADISAAFLFLISLPMWAVFRQKKGVG